MLLCRFDRTHRLRHRMIGEAPHLMDPEVLDSTSTEDGKQRGLYYIPCSQGRSPESAGEFVNSIFEVGLPLTACSQEQHHALVAQSVAEESAGCRQQGLCSLQSQQAVWTEVIDDGCLYAVASSSRLDHSVGTVVEPSLP
jgi:hypothetical protein